MAFISGRKALIELFRQEGVEFVFGNPGSTELPLMDAFVHEKSISYVLGLQEGAVVGMADGYAQASGKVAVVNVHAAPGLGSALGMIYNSYRSGTPMLITAGQHDQSVTFSEPMAGWDMPPMARPLVKWSGEVTRLADLPRAVHRAMKLARTPPTGPVFLSIPVDVLMDEAELDLGAPTQIGLRFRADAGEISRAAALLGKSERPAIIVGDAVQRSDSFAEIVALAEMLGAPVYTDGCAAASSFPSSHPLFAGTITRLGPSIRATLEKFDTVFSAGGELFMLSLPSEVEVVPPGVQFIHLDDNAYEIGKNYPAQVALWGDVKATLPELSSELARNLGPAQKKLCAQRMERITGELAASRRKLKDAANTEAGLVPIRAPSLWSTLGDILPADTIVVEETISLLGRLQEFLHADDRLSFFGMRGGGIGWGLPAAVGAKIAQPNRPVVCLSGDGSALYSCQALWTAAHRRIGGLVFIILNNGGYRILKQRTRLLKGDAAQSGIYPAMDIEKPQIDYLALAQTFGVKARQVTTLEQVREAVLAGLAADEPIVVDVVLDRSF